VTRRRKRSAECGGAPILTAGRWNLFVHRVGDIVLFVPVNRWSGHCGRISWMFQELWDSLDQATSEEVVMSVFDKLPSATGSGQSREWVDVELTRRCPMVSEMLSTHEVSGKPRKSASLSVWVEPQEGWKACLNERQEGFVLFSCSDSLMGAIEALEALLELPSPPWRKVVSQAHHTTTRRKA